MKVYLTLYLKYEFAVFIIEPSGTVNYQFQFTPLPSFIGAISLNPVVPAYIGIDKQEPLFPSGLFDM